jgi:hypothetical protein
VISLYVWGFSEGGAYKTVGQMMATIVGNRSAHVYRLLVYQRQDRIEAAANITPEFKFTVQPCDEMSLALLSLTCRR